MRLLRRLRWPLRDPAIREARDDDRDAQAAIRAALEAEIEALRLQNAQLQSSLAAALVASGLMQHYYAGIASKRQLPDTEKTAEAPAPGYRGPVGRHQRTEVHPRATQKGRRR